MHEKLIIFATVISCMYVIASKYPKSFASIECIWKYLFYLSACYISFSLGAKYPETPLSKYILENDLAIFLYFVVIVSPYYVIKIFFYIAEYNKESHIDNNTK